MREPIWLDLTETLALHDRLLALDGGALGLRDEALLQSALARPRRHYAYDAAADIVPLGGILTSGIVANHPFVDGNKRTGFVLGILFLELNGYSFTASEPAAANAVLALASGQIDEGGYVAFLRDNTRAEIG